MKLEYCAQTDNGRKYDHNEDFYSLPDSGKAEADSLNKTLFILCDGMGGGNAGEVASQMTVNWLSKGFYLQQSEKQGFINFLKNKINGNDYDLTKKSITEVIINTNEKIKKLASEHEQYKGMGTTLVSLLFYRDRVIIHSVGDSRCYRFREGILEQLTEDQSEVWSLYKTGAITKEEMRKHPRNNIISMAIGISGELLINDYMFDVKQGDLYIVCSDGLSDMLSDDDIQNILQKDTSLKALTEKLINSANEAGGKDNITAILVQADNK